MPLTYKKLYHISVTVPQDNGMAKWMVGPIYLTLVRASTQLPIVFLHPWLLFISCPCSTLNILCLLWNVNSTVKVLQSWLLFCVRMMSPVPCALSTMMLWLLKLMKHTVIWSMLLYWRHSTSLGKLFLTRNCWSCFWKLLVNKSSMAMTGWRFWWFWYEISKLSETQSHMKTGVVLETLDLARWIMPLGNFWWEWFFKLIVSKHAWHCCSVKLMICFT